MAYISDFLDELAANQELFESYTEEPEATMTGFGLEPDQQEIILTGNIDSLRSVLEAEVGPKPYVIVRVIVRPPHKGDDESGS